jgi:hypothetical protein
MSVLGVEVAMSRTLLDAAHLVKYIITPSSRAA